MKYKLKIFFFMLVLGSFFFCFSGSKRMMQDHLPISDYQSVLPSTPMKRNVSGAIKTFGAPTNLSAIAFVDLVTREPVTWRKYSLNFKLSC